MLEPFDRVVTEHGPVVMRVCRAMLGPADADDAWSETFVAALRTYPDLRADSNVRGWLVTIAYRKAVDQVRARRRAPQPTEHLPEPAVEDDVSAFDERLRGALDGLPPKQHGAVVYHYLADLPYAQVGALLGTSADAARRAAADGIAQRKTYTKGQPR